MKNKFSKILNEEQTYDICLSLIALDNYYFDGPAGLFITWKICKDNDLDINSISTQDLTDKINQQLTEKSLEILVRHDIIEVDISGKETLYKNK